nr:hypothetical protein [Fodinicola feengrottensis]
MRARYGRQPNAMLDPISPSIIPTIKPPRFESTSEASEQSMVTIEMNIRCWGANQKNNPAVIRMRPIVSPATAAVPMLIIVANGASG